MTPTSIMLVDDNPTFLRIATLFLLENENITIVSSLNGGRNVVEQARELKPDIVIMDLSMPEVHGIEIIPVLRKEIPQIGIVTLTLHDTKEYRAAALMAGADAFIAKPSMQNDLMPAIERVRESQILKKKHRTINKIMVLEDDNGLRSIYKRVLEHSGYEVHQAETLDEARKLLKDNSFDLWIIDLNLKDGKGSDLILEQKPYIKRNSTKVIIISGHSEYHYVEEELNVDIYMQKPVSVNALITFIARLELKYDSSVPL